MNGPCGDLWVSVTCGDEVNLPARPVGGGPRLEAGTESLVVARRHPNNNCEAHVFNAAEGSSERHRGAPQFSECRQRRAIPQAPTGHTSMGPRPTLQAL